MHWLLICVISVLFLIHFFLVIQSECLIFSAKLMHVEHASVLGVPNHMLNSVQKIWRK